MRKYQHSSKTLSRKTDYKSIVDFTSNFMLSFTNYLHSISGFSSIIPFQDIDDAVIDQIETFQQNDLINLLEKSKLDKEEYVYFYGSFSNNTTAFLFGIDDKILLHKIADHVNRIVKKMGKNDATKYFNNPGENIQLCAIKDWYFVNADICYFETAENTETQTHFLLNKLLKNADNNMQRPKGGYRFDQDVMDLAKFFRLLSGRMAYETLQNNLPLALPSISTIDRHIHRSHLNIVEGVLRCEELKIYLIDRNCELVVSLSEDATNIDNRVQYDKNTNQLVGFVLPTHYMTGMPIPLAFKARTAQEILHHFNSGINTAKCVNTVMAKPIDGTPAFCLLIFGSDGKYSSMDVSNRWKLITERLNEHSIRVLSIASDSDPRYNSAMKANSMLGTKSDSLPDWFCSNNFSPPFYFQDAVHIATKMRNLLLRTIGKKMKLPFGKKGHQCFIQLDHLKQLLNFCGKDKHRMTQTTINPRDRQNFDSAMRLCHTRVIFLLIKHIKQSEATVMFLNIMRDSVLAFLEEQKSPLERVEMVWYSIFMLRIWREHILSHRLYTLKDNFLTANCYSCLELNAHSLISLLIYLKDTEQPHLFVPQMFNSQPCESFFRQLRSFTTTYSTIASCSVKEILSRINKIQLMDDTSHNMCTIFNFPRHQKTKTLPNIPNLPNKEQIIETILECRSRAISDAKKFNLIGNNFKFACNIKPHILNSTEKELSNQEFESEMSDDMEQLKSISLINYAEKFADKEVDENSSYAEIFGDDGSKRLIVRKTSLCWLFRTNYLKLSSDRLQRVKCGYQPKRRPRQLSFPIYSSKGALIKNKSNKKRK